MPIENDNALFNLDDAPAPPPSRPEETAPEESGHPAESVLMDPGIDAGSVSASRSEGGISAEAVGFKVVGQAAIRSVLGGVIAGGRLAHAYLFAGSEGSGRLQMALELARVLNCTATPPAGLGQPCPCSSCRAMVHLQHPNLSLVFPLPRAETNEEEIKAQKVFDEIVAEIAQEPYARITFAASKTGQILMERIRDLRSRFSLAQDRPGMRVAIVFPAEKLRDDSANAMLKNLEEPTPGCILILIAESPADMLSTIVSRCQVIRFPVPSDGDITEALVNNAGIAQEQAGAIAHLSGGNYARALELAREEGGAQTDAALDYLRAAATGNAPGIVQAIAQWEELGARQNILEQLDYTGMWLRDALLFKVKPQSPDAGLDPRGEVVARMASQFRTDQLSEAAAAVEEARLGIAANQNSVLALTALGLRIHGIMQGAKAK